MALLGLVCNEMTEVFSFKPYSPNDLSRQEIFSDRGHEVAERLLLDRLISSSRSGFHRFKECIGKPDDMVGSIEPKEIDLVEKLTL